MNYEQAEKFIHSTLNFGSKPGLSRITELCERLGNPQDDLKFVHVAGTNGKGSTVTMIACALEDAGFTVGKFTSPYVYNFRERIEVNGKMITEDALAEITETVKAECEKMDDHPTEFEIITAIAFIYFKSAGCDYVVLEVGLGGRLDATNIIKSPLLSVICSISLDHTDILGDTVEKIAKEKAGIVKEKCPCVVYPLNSESVMSVFKSKCIEKHSALHTPDISKLTSNSYTSNQNTFRYKGVKYTLSLLGKHQMYNALTAICALELLGVEGDAIVSGVNRATVHGRYEVLCEKPRIILDAGHNQSGIESLVRAIKNDKKITKLTIIFGMLKDKAYQYAIRELASIADKMICVAPDSPRALTAYDMKNIAEMFCVKSYAFTDVKEAVEYALDDADGRTVLVCGSFYLIDKISKELNKLL